MKLTSPTLLTLACILAGAVHATEAPKPSIQGDYLEVRTCDVYTGPCFANGEVGLAGKEAMLMWSVREGAWEGVGLEGLSVIAVVRTEDTLGNQDLHPQSGRAMLIVDEQASAEQREALTDLARTLSDGLIGEIVATETSAIASSLGDCPKSGCATVQAEHVEIATRCLGEGDHACGNETTYYPPLTAALHATPAYTTLASF
jgi:hypothetical protein